MKPEPEDRPSRYLKAQALCFVLTAAVISLFTFSVDPWGIWHGVVISGFNEHKFSAWRYQQLHKATAVACRRPDSVIAGSSRSLALLPANLGFTEQGLRPYNLALNGARIQDVERYLDLAYAVGEVSDVVIGIDFFMFGGRPQSETRRDLDRLEWFSEHPGCVPDPGDWLPTLLSQDALRAARRSWQRQHRPEVSSRTLPDGTWGALDLHDDIARRGQRRLFRRAEATLKATVYEDMISDPRFEEGFASLEAIFESARRHGARIHVLISPAHARLLELIHELGLWEEFETWKRQLVSVVERAQASPIVDFSGYHAIATEPVPEEGEIGVEMHWWWDPSHYSPATGDLILDRMLGSADSTRDGLSGFGYPLERSGIEAHLIQIREDRVRYLDEYGDDLVDLAKD